VLDRFKGKCALITGGAGSIGASLAKACLDQGIRVAIADINQPELDRIQRELGHGPDSLMSIILDVRKPEDWERVANEVEQRLGPVRLLFNNAGVTSTQAVMRGGGLENLTFEEWQWTLDVNLNGTFLGLKTFVPRFKATDEPTYIINTASMAACAPLLADGGHPLSYAASKAGVVHMTAQLRTDFNEKGIKSIGVSILYPGQTKSDMFVISYQLSPGSSMDDFDVTQGRRTFYQQGAEAELIGPYVLERMEKGDFHIFTHADWRDNVVAYGDELRHSFVRSADPSFSDPAAKIVDLTWAKSWPDQK